MCAKLNGTNRSSKQLRGVVWCQQALKGRHSDPMSGSGGAPAEPPAAMSPAAMSAYIVGMKALLAHEAALKRGPVDIRCAQQLTANTAHLCLTGATPHTLLICSAIDMCCC